MSRASGKNKEDVKKDASVSSRSEDDDEAMEDGGREETLDVFSAWNICWRQYHLSIYCQTVTYFFALGNGR